MKIIKEMLRVCFWGASMICVMIWGVMVPMIVMNVAGGYDLTFMAWVSVALVGFGVWSFWDDRLAFIWDGVDK